MKTEIIQVEEKGFTERFLFTLKQSSFKRFPDKLETFFIIPPVKSGPDGKIPPAPPTNQIAGYVEFRPLTH